ncbi:MAG: T9SS type A sorting domain-containing protein [Bacteroidetes bacterium]|nr:T9SS type A sorting domain-containing protein [Bacteroidota bacterium]
MKKFYKQFLFTTGLLMITLGVFGQDAALKPVAKMVAETRNAGIPFKKAEPFTPQINSPYKISTSTFAKDITFASLSSESVKTLFTNKSEAIELSIPYKESAITLDLVQVNIFADGFEVLSSADGGKVENFNPGVYYQGTIKDDPSSIVAISIFEDEIMGVISSSDKGNINVGRYGKGLKSDYMIYSDWDVIVNPASLGCATADNPDYLDEFHQLMEIEGSSRITNCPKIYFEADYQLYQNKGSVTATANYITGIYNNSAVIYTNESVPTQISTIFVWSTADGYASGSSYDALNSFMAFRTSFTGDIAHLVALDPGGLGGVAATINGLCNSYKYCYSDIDATYNDFPTYSWTVMVVTHEMGHLFGSYHTQNCGAWVGGALDNCYTTEGGCPAGPAPVGGGTIMSYCHLTGYGINLANGFGVQPGNAIRNTISAAGCVTSCGGVPAYCLSKGLSTADEWLQTVTMNGTTKNSGNNSGYADFTATTINLTPGVSAGFTLTPGYTGTVYPEYFSIWIDYNKDLDFNDAGENVYNSGAATAAVSGSFVVTAGMTGTTRMRVSMKYNALATSCETFDYGEVEDYTVSFNPVITYCSSAGTSSTTRYIDYVKLNTINRTSGSDGGYYNGTGTLTNIVKGTTYTLTYSAGFSGTIYQMYWRGWIDYNRDGDFSDAGEQVFQKKATTAASLTKNILVPTTASTGTTRLRISAKYGAYPTACETFANGEVEDYTVNIMPALPSGEVIPFSLTVFPNPGSGVFNIEFLNAISGGVQLDVFDITGKIISSENIESENGMIVLDITNAAPGLYFVKTTQADGTTAVKQIVKQ